MTMHKFSSLLLLTCVLIIAAFSVWSSASINHELGFTTSLIQRDSAMSPSYNPSLTNWDRVRSSLHRSISRVNLFRLSMSSSPGDNFESQVVAAKGEYVMEVSLGTPPVSQMAIADTGSDLIWLQCQPCIQCYHQKLPIFDPEKSSSYKHQPCESDACKGLSDRSSCTQRNTCSYTYSYGDQSRTQGDLATETLTFGERNDSSSVASFPNVVLGCGHNNEGTFREDGSGLIGLGGGPLSLVSQLSSSVGGKFSYCLIPFFEQGNLSSKISFGQEGQVSGADVVSTPLIKKTPDTFYFLTLEGLSVGDSNETSSFIPFSFKRTSLASEMEEGNIIIDSGTTLTMLPSEMFSNLKTNLVEKIQGKQVEDPSGQLGLCYQSVNGGKDLNIPSIIAHFSGAKVVLNAVNTFVEVADNVVCLAMVAADEIAIWGNIAQTNFLVGYDLQAAKVSFKPTDCSKY